MNKKYITGVSIVRFSGELLQAIYRAPGGVLKLRDKNPRQWNYWTVRHTYAPTSRHIDRLVFEKHMFRFNPETRNWDDTIAPHPKTVYVDASTAVLLQQGKKTRCIPYTPGLRMALDEAGIYCFYTKVPPLIYSTVPSTVEAWFAGVPRPTICPVESGIRAGSIQYRIPTGSDLVVQTRYEPDGETTKIVFATDPERAKRYIESVVGREIDDFQNVWREHLDHDDELIL